MIILDKISKKCIIRLVNRALCARKIVILFATRSLLKIFKRVHGPPVRFIQTRPNLYFRQRQKFHSFFSTYNSRSNLTRIHIIN